MLARGVRRTGQRPMERVAPRRVARPGRRPELDAIRTLVVVGLVLFFGMRG